MKEVNLERILESEYSYCPAFGLTDTQKEFVIYAMREACIQTIDLCIENAETYSDIGGYTFVDTEKIAKTEKQII